MVDNGLLCPTKDFVYGVIKLKYPCFSPMFPRKFEHGFVVKNIIRLGVVWKVQAGVSFPEVQVIYKEDGENKLLKYCGMDYISQIIEKGNALMSF